MTVPLCEELPHLKMLGAFLLISPAKKARKVNIYSCTVLAGHSSSGFLVYAQEFTGRKSLNYFIYIVWSERITFCRVRLCWE